MSCVLSKIILSNVVAVEGIGTFVAQPVQRNTHSESIEITDPAVESEGAFASDGVHSKQNKLKVPLGRLPSNCSDPKIEEAQSSDSDDVGEPPEPVAEMVVDTCEPEPAVLFEKKLEAILKNIKRNSEGLFMDSSETTVLRQNSVGVFRPESRIRSCTNESVGHRQTTPLEKNLNNTKVQKFFGCDESGHSYQSGRARAQSAPLDGLLDTVQDMLHNCAERVSLDSEFFDNFSFDGISAPSVTAFDMSEGQNKRRRWLPRRPAPRVSAKCSACDLDDDSHFEPNASLGPMSECFDNPMHKQQRNKRSTLLNNKELTRNEKKKVLKKATDEAPVYVQIEVEDSSSFDGKKTILGKVVSHKKSGCFGKGRSDYTIIANQSHDSYSRTVDDIEMVYYPEIISAQSKRSSRGSDQNRNSTPTFEDEWGLETSSASGSMDGMDMYNNPLRNRCAQVI